MKKNTKRINYQIETIDSSTTQGAKKKNKNKNKNKNKKIKNKNKLRRQYTKSAKEKQIQKVKKM